MLAEYLFKYRMLKPWARLLILCLLGVLPGAWNYLEVAPILEAQYDEASSKEQNSRKKLADAKAVIKDLPAMEEKLSSTKDQLKKAEARLPNEIFVDEVLQFVSKAANENDVSIGKFEPVSNKLIPGDYPYMEVRFKISMDGRYGRLGEWLDTVGGSQSKAYVKSWDIRRGLVVDKEKPANPNQPAPGPVAGSKEEAELARERLKLAMVTELVLYSAANEAQLAGAAPVASGANGKDNVPGNGADKKAIDAPKDNAPASGNPPKTGGSA